MKRGRKFFSLSLVTAMTLSLVACGSDTAGTGTGSAQTDGTSTQKESTSTEKTSEGKSMTVVETTAVTSIDPLDAGSAILGNAVALVYAGLYTLDENGSAVLDLAESVEKSDDLLTWTFTLKDAKWSNGDPVTAYDYEYAWKRLVNIENYDGSDASSYPINAGIKNAAAIAAGEVPYTELGCYAKDDKTFVVEFESVVTYAEEVLALPSFYPVQQAFVEECGSMFGLGKDYILCNGPFLVEDYELGNTYWSYTRNPDFVGYQTGESNLETLEYQLIQDSQQAMLAYTSGDADVVSISGEQVETYQSEPGFTQIKDARTTYMAINCEKITNDNLKQALAHAIDKEALCKDVIKDGSTPAYTIVPYGLAVDESGTDFAANSGVYQETDKELAAQYWEAAKKELGVDTYTMEFLITSDEAAYTVGAYIQDQIQTTLSGVTVELKTVPFKNKMEYVTSGDFDFCIIAWGGDYPDPLTFLNCYITGYPINVSKWSDAEYDTVIEDVLAGKYDSSVTERFEALHRAEDIFMNGASVVVLYQNADCKMINPKVTGIEYHSMGVDEAFRNVVISD